jgi:hypothetical protein
MRADDEDEPDRAIFEGEVEPNRASAARSTSIVAATISGPIPSPGNTRRRVAAADVGVAAGSAGSVCDVMKCGSQIPRHQIACAHLGMK